MENMNMSNGYMSSQIVNFLCEGAENPEGLTVEKIIAMTDSELEQNHKFIQWVFPLTEPSAMVPGSPYLSTSDAILLSVNNIAKTNIQKMLNRMKEFYSKTNFITPFNHNFKRITRILKCLVLMGMKADAEVFYAFIIGQADTDFKKLCIRNADKQFWQSALR